MSYNSIQDNPYYQAAEEGLSESMQRINEMEADFHPSMMKEYEDVKHKLLQHAVDLVKFGVDKEVTDDNVILTINDKTYRINKKELLEHTGEEQFSALFPKPENYRETDGETTDKIDEYQQRNDPYLGHNVYDRVSPYMNPLRAMLSYLLMPMGSSYPNTPDMAGGPFSQPYGGHFQARDNSSGSDILQDVNSVQKKVIALEQEKNEARERADRLKNQCAKLYAKEEELNKQIETMKEDSTAIIEALRQEKDELESMYAQVKDGNDQAVRVKEEELQNAIQSKADLESQLENVKQQLDTANASLQETSNALKESNAALADAESKAKDAEDRARDAAEKAKQAEISLNKEEYENEKRKSDNRISDLERQLNDTKEKLNKNNRKIEESERYISNLKKEKDSLQGELKTVRKNKEDLESDIKKLREGDKEKEVYYRELESKAKELEKLAYKDAKFGTKNLNAFNKDFVSVSKDNTVLSIVGISGMKIINLSYGRDKGDNAIQMVAEKLMDAFGNSNVYRIMGDQFTIISQGGNYEDIQQKLNRIKDELSGVQISIIYGIALGAHSNDLQSMIKEAENACLMMKSGAGNGFSMSSVHQQQESAPEVAPEPPKPTVIAPGEPEDVDMDEMLMNYMDNE